MNKGFQIEQIRSVMFGFRYLQHIRIKAYLITQDIRQIVEAYGENESIVSNCHVRVAFTPNQQDTCKLLSTMTGTQTVQEATYTFSGKRNAPVMDHVSASYGYTWVATYGDCDNRTHRSMVDILHEERLDMKDAEYEGCMARDEAGTLKTRHRRALT
jgi:hypothetical protein